ncbi:ADP-ribosylation factor [Aplysia californica]|uniref:ADP-ribosylation factor n=1 Tax=Aplysia californica TaxID=6500 RepID=A0ABM0K7Z9_APLCA|nr:ADP-ribosylation factor [Aplysia californica]
MGNCSPRKAESAPPQIIVVGTVSSGKNTILQHLKKESLPSVGLDGDTVTLNGIALSSWELGGRSSLQFFFRLYYKAAQGIVLVVDSAMHEYMDHAFDYFNWLILQEEETKGMTVMVLANKQDLPQALNCEEVEKRFREKFPSTPDHKIFFKPCVATTGEGIREAFNEFSTKLKLADANNPEGGNVEKGKKEKSMKSFFKKPISFVKSVLMY